MVYIHENLSLYDPKVLEKLKFWRSFKQKNIYLFRTMQTILNIETLNSWKYFFCPECEITSFVKINLRKILRKSNFTLSSTIFI